MVLNIRFIAHGSELDQPGNFLMTDRLSLPISLKPEFAKLLVAAAVAATVASIGALPIDDAAHFVQCV